MKKNKLITLLVFLLIFQSLFSADLLFIEHSLSDDPMENRQNIYSIYQFDLSSGSLQFLKEFRFSGNSFFFYSEYENKTYIFENWQQTNREQNIYTIGKTNGDFIIQKQDFELMSESSFIDSESSPQRVLVPNDFQPNNIVDRDFNLMVYDYRFQYRNGWKNFGPKYCEITNENNEIEYSFYLQPHLGFEEDQQLHFNHPRLIGDSRIVYDNRISDNETFLYNYMDDSLERQDGFLHGVSYLGESFVVSNFQSIAVYDENFNMKDDLSDYPISNKVHIYKNILFSYSPYIPGWFWPNHVLVYDLENNEEIYFEEDSAILDSGNFWFLGFYE